jgi:hypothetical protein
METLTSSHNTVMQEAETTVNDTPAQVNPTAMQVKNFWKKVVKGEPGECWKWTGAKTPRGYGRIMLKPKVCLAHRMAWTCSRGAIPDGLCVLHNCDNPECTNPSHLRIGTHQENMCDMVTRNRCNPLKGDDHPFRINPERAPRGETNGMAKLNKEKVSMIRSLYREGGETYHSLAFKFGVSFGLIGEVVRHRIWRHIA